MSFHERLLLVVDHVLERFNQPKIDGPIRRADQSLGTLALACDE